MYLFFDTETTGPNKAKDRTVQIAWILTNANGDVIEEYCFIIKPSNFQIPSSATAIHGISTDKALSEGHELDQVLLQFIESLNKALLIVAHNVDFDIGIIRNDISKLGLPDPFEGKPRICTMRSSTEWCGLTFYDGRSGFKWPKLEELHYKLFESYIDGAHDALVDVIALKKCFFGLVGLEVIRIPEKTLPLATCVDIDAVGDTVPFDYSISQGVKNSSEKQGHVYFDCTMHYLQARKLLETRISNNPGLNGVVVALKNLIKEFPDRQIVPVLDNRVITDNYLMTNEWSEDELESIEEEHLLTLKLLESTGIPFIRSPQPELTFSSVVKYSENVQEHIYVCTPDRNLLIFANPHVEIVNSLTGEVYAKNYISKTIGISAERFSEFLALTGLFKSRSGTIKPVFAPVTSKNIMAEYSSIDQFLEDKNSNYLNNKEDKQSQVKMNDSYICDLMSHKNDYDPSQITRTKYSEDKFLSICGEHNLPRSVFELATILHDSL